MTKVRWFVAFFATALALDQLTKAWARHALRGHTPIDVIDGFFQLRYAENPGGAFSVSVGPAVLIVAGFIILGVIGVAFWRADREDRRLAAALGLLAAGGAGNLVDRIAVGRVVDFVLWRAGSFSWPLFNIADAALVLGIAALFLVRSPRRKPAAA